jgi:glycosyltransferase involved in cell wall biosynthesis
MSILFLVPYPLKEAPSQRFRFEQYIETLKEKGHRLYIQSFLNASSWRHFAERGYILLKVLFFISGFTRRVFILPLLFRFDFVFIHREAAPIGPPVFEWLIAKVFRKKIIYDFDDALWVTDRLAESGLLKLIKWRSKVASICKWSYRVSCGNHYLCDYSLRFNRNVVYNPTTIDTEWHHIPSDVLDKQENRIIIGWTGSHSTLKYLKSLEKVLQEIERDFPFVAMVVIADQKPALNLKSLVYKPWSVDCEIQDLSKFDIGLMPLPDDAWTRGKCGFKVLQYMALQIPTVASPTGVNSSIIEHDRNGFLACSEADWKNYLSVLISDAALRQQFGRAGREKVVHHYSVRSNLPTFLTLFT